MIVDRLWPRAPHARTPSCPAARKVPGDLRAAVLLACAFSVAPPAAAIEGTLEEVVVTSTLRPLPARDLAGSVAVLDATTLHGAGQQHFEDTLALVPNLNWAGDTSRPRYFQIRGIGELEQYQGAPNPSIGFLIDDIDFSGLGGAATTFDIDRIEVLRGPQGTRYGANALGGLIYVASAAPADEFGGHADIDMANYGTRSIGAVLTGPVTALDSAFRIAVQRSTSDGYYRNTFLDRRNTNGRDELTVRGRWRYQPSDRLRIDVSALHVQLDNGYDAFSPDNSRTTHSDHPSVDAQHSTGASVRATYGEADTTTLTGIATWGDTRVKYGYDGDWGNPIYWAPYTYDFTALQYRDRRTASMELRLGTAANHGFAWLVGAYASQLHESLNDTGAGISNDPVNGLYQANVVTDSAYQARNYAWFGVLDGDFTPRLRWSVGLRAERRTTDYQSLTRDRVAGADTPAAFNPGDHLWGGHASLTYRLEDTASVYATVSRGYKAGGFNLSPSLTTDQTLFRPEADWSVEAGYKAELQERRLRIDADVFAVRRDDAQLKTSAQSDPNDPNTFVYYTGNAAHGFNYGLETSIDWQATPRLALGGSLGLLHTEFRNFTQTGLLNAEGSSQELPNAPHWQGAVHAVYRGPAGAFARLDATGMGSYQFDLPPNPTRSAAYGLVHAKLGWESRRLSVYLWGRNLLDKNYPVRGFFFGLEPPNYPNKLYLQLGNPRTFGLNAVGHFGG